jgi:hypothetical protein
MFNPIISSILSDVRTKQWRRRAEASVIDQHRDAGVRAQRRLDPRQIRPAVEVRCDRLDRPAGLARQAFGQSREPLAVAGDKDQVVAAPRETIGVDGADARRGAGDKRGSLALDDSHNVVSFIAGRPPARERFTSACAWLKCHISNLLRHSRSGPCSASVSSSFPASR